jgi:hypothetical protein
MAATGTLWFLDHVNQADTINSMSWRAGARGTYPVR